MYTRQLQPPKRSYLLLGPRGTGKTTWLNSFYPNATRYDLLKPSEFFRLQLDPERFEREVLALPKGSTVVIDEVQKLPALLDVIHGLLSEKKAGHNFVMTGASARKLKRSSANLLAGRASFRQFFPLIQNEYLHVDSFDSVFKFGTLPEVFTAKNKSEQIEFLESYALTYLREEIQQEVATKNIDSFSRFLNVAALCNAQVTNISSISRDAGVARSTVQGYFQALLDTLVGVWLPSWQPRARVKEIEHPKFFFFDCGVARVLSGQVRESLSSMERGFLLETYLFHELRAWREYQNNQAKISYWKTKDSEVDFILELNGKVIGIEVKSTPHWKAEYGKTLHKLHEEKVVDQIYGVFLGERAQKDGKLKILPLAAFLKELWQL